MSPNDKSNTGSEKSENDWDWMFIDGHLNSIVVIGFAYLTAATLGLIIPIIEVIRHV